MGHWPATLGLVSLAALATAPQALAAGGTDWTTYAFDNQRTGYNPEETTLGTDNVGRLIPRNIITSFVCLYNGVEVYRAELHPAISANPYISFCTVATGFHR